jgi:O-acetyl-ADP-ribose deacetylase (regulator of RNase III)
MAIKIKTQIGNLLHVKAGHIVHGCNAQGVMGSGVALGVKQDFPQAYEAYTQVYTKHGLKLGQAYPVLINPQLMIWNAVTQNLYGKGTRMVSYDAVQECFQIVNDYISQGLEDVANMQPNEVHIPLIGAARGGGNWEIIREIIEQTMDYPVTLWLPDATVTTR